MIDLAQEDLLPIEGPAQVLFHALALDCHAENVGDAAEKYDVALAELTFRPTIDLEHAEWDAVPAEDDVHGAPDAVLNQQFGGAEPFLDIEMVGDHGFSGLQRISGR